MINYPIFESFTFFYLSQNALAMLRENCLRRSILIKYLFLFENFIIIFTYIYMFETCLYKEFSFIPHERL